MASEEHRFPFRWVLPAFELIICVATVWPFWYLAGSELFVSLRKPKVESLLIPSTITNLNLPTLETPQEKRQRTLVEIRLHLPVALNLPVKFIQLPYVVLSRDKTEWTPKENRWIPRTLSFPEIWQALTWPIIGVVFWWMSGRSLETLAAARKRVDGPRINLIELAFGMSFVLLGLLICVVFTFDSYSTAREYVLAAGGGLWAILGSVIVAAAIVQWRIRRGVRKQIAAPAKN